MAYYPTRASRQVVSSREQIFQGAQTRQHAIIPQQVLLRNESNMTEYQRAMPLSSVAFHPGIWDALDLIDGRWPGPQKMIAETNAFEREVEARERLEKEAKTYTYDGFVSIQRPCATPDRRLMDWQWHFGGATMPPTETMAQASARTDAPGPSDQYNIEAPPVVVSTGATYDNTNTADDWVDGDIVETSTTLDEQEALSSPTTSSSSAENSEMWRVLEREHEEAFRASLRQLAACNALSELRRATLAEYSSSEGELASPY
ncbi:uncharacterized protein C8Q71DRAFT_551121 [Rhodofomes roseus]|uniref:Uncharacterized protein n=1 Tax=Rhodofomes roseus TaxID=34475 RepID=A0ABQ8KI05_9APHY|nr:uncharacterized protein C8Q71DRAFT_551121 [Rhodofomes roseus]KAH9837588.1 hypothetical protein C8Q71DRAFT_551121 [Rhodofomes roseus]